MLAVAYLPDAAIAGPAFRGCHGSATADLPLSEFIDNELHRRLPEGGRKYRLKETPSVVYAADDKVFHSEAAGDTDEVNSRIQVIFHV